MHGYIDQSFFASYTSANAHLPMYSWSTSASTSAPPALLRPRTLVAFLKVTIPLALLSLGLTFALWDPHVEVAFYARKWVKQEVHALRPLAGCFAPARVSPAYNLSDALYGKKTTLVHAGMPLRLGMDCYDFAGTIQGTRPVDALHGEERTYYHTYWRTDLAAFGPRQEWMLKSFFATQDTEHTTLVLRHTPVP